MQIFSLTLLLTIFTIYFSTQNTVGVTVRFADKTIAIFPLYVIVVFALLLGFLISYIFSLTDRISAENNNKRENKVITEEEKLIKRLTTHIEKLENDLAEMKIQLTVYEKHVPQKISTPIEVKEVKEIPQPPPSA